MNWRVVPLGTEVNWPPDVSKAVSEFIIIYDTGFTYNIYVFIIWVPSNEKMPSNVCKMCRFRSFCACAKYQTGICSPLIHLIVSNDSDREGPDKTTWMHRLIWAFAVCIYPKTHFHMALPI